MPGSSSGVGLPAGLSAASRRRMRRCSMRRSQKCSRTSRKRLGRNKKNAAHKQQEKEGEITMNANKTKFKVGPIIALVLFGALVVPAQDPAQFKEMFVRSQQQNAQALKQYTWKSRSEVRKNGESKNTQM